MITHRFAHDSHTIFIMGRLSINRPDALTAEDDRVLEKAIRLSVDRAGDLICEVDMDATQRDQRAALKVLHKIKQLQTERASPVAGDWWVWDANRKNDPDYLPTGLGLSPDKMAGAPHGQPDPRTPARVRKYLGGRRHTPESRSRLAKDAVERVKAYRERVPSWWFRIVAGIMTHPESIPKQ